MKIAADKCASFEIKPTKDSWYLADPTLHSMTGEAIPTSKADSALRYLVGGHTFPPGMVCNCRIFQPRYRRHCGASGVHLLSRTKSYLSLPLIPFLTSFMPLPYPYLLSQPSARPILRFAATSKTFYTSRSFVQREAGWGTWYPKSRNSSH
jgi:hypothetical protein